jgi:hypothetical protein
MYQTNRRFRILWFVKSSQILINFGDLKMLIFGVDFGPIFERFWDPKTRFFRTGPKNPNFGWWTPFLRNMNIGNYFLPKNNIAILGVSKKGVFRKFRVFGEARFLTKICSFFWRFWTPIFDDFGTHFLIVFGVLYFLYFRQNFYKFIFIIFIIRKVFL